MRILIAEDDPVSRCLLQVTLTRWNHELTVTSDGEEALAAMVAESAPPLAILDWMMPKLDGVEVCRMIRAGGRTPPPYIILLTAKSGREALVEGLDAGANDYIVKPFDREELRARVGVGIRVVELQRALADRIVQLEETLAQVKQLQGLLPICTYCKRIRDDENYWQRVEEYITRYTDARFTHGVCPECLESILKPQLEQLQQRVMPGE